jgi:hypothetical protein
LAGLGSIASIERRLTAAGLPLVKLDRTAYSSQYFNRACADRRPHLIDHTGYE